MKREELVLLDFLSTPLWDTRPIFDRFANLPNAQFNELKKDGNARFVYIPGTREDRVLLVAHADTVWDINYRGRKPEHKVGLKGKYYYSINSSGVGLGADDRSGCAIIWQLKDLGHSILIVDGEEMSSLGGSSYIVSYFPELHDELNEHQFMVQFDRRNGKDFKCYSVGSAEFRKYIKKETGYIEPDRYSYTDIVTLCKKATGVNLSVGYRNEHTKDEIIDYHQWLHTLQVSRRWLSKPQPKFIITDRLDYADFGY
jgi:hypothetical protein